MLQLPLASIGTISEVHEDLKVDVAVGPGAHHKLEADPLAPREGRQLWAFAHERVLGLAAAVLLLLQKPQRPLGRREAHVVASCFAGAGVGGQVVVAAHHQRRALGVGVAAIVVRLGHPEVRRELNILVVLVDVIARSVRPVAGVVHDHLAVADHKPVAATAAERGARVAIRLHASVAGAGRLPLSDPVAVAAARGEELLDAEAVQRVAIWRLLPTGWR
mmetsp:Transcript_90174/g.232780  ORF Transcript_90174/g.232780 Transcript_90174/m.232780 type:complete len:219 (-) Transcript_90174:1277-1933(-)